MKQIVLSEQEARIMIRILKSNWISQEYQNVMLEMILRVEKELEAM